MANQTIALRQVLYYYNIKHYDYFAGTVKRAHYKK